MQRPNHGVAAEALRPTALLGPVAYRDPATLRPYPGNARTHSKAQIKQIANSIAAFGFVNPVLLSERDEIIAGHGRVPMKVVLTCQWLRCIR